MTFTLPAISGFLATSDEHEELNSVSLLNIKNNSPIINPSRKDTLGLMEMKKMHSSSHDVPKTDGDNLDPTTETAIMPIPKRQKVKAIDMGSVGEEDEESFEEKSLINIE